MCLLPSSIRDCLLDSASVYWRSCSLASEFNPTQIGDQQKDMFTFYEGAGHAELVDKSLRKVAEGFPDEVLAEIHDLQGRW